MIDNKPNICVFTQRYLNLSMTFVYWQLKAVSSTFNPWVLTSNEVDNLDIYPFENIFAKKKSSLGRLYRFYKKNTGHFAVLSSGQKKYFRDILKKKDIKLIHAHFGPAGIEILPLAKELGIPLVVTFHGYDASVLLNNKNYLNDLKPILKDIHAITVSGYMAGKLVDIGADPSKVHVLYCGVSMEKFPFVEREPVTKKIQENRTVTFLQVSNFHEKKGHRYTVEAFSRIAREYKNVKLVLAGGGGFKDEMEKLSSDLGIRDRVEFPGSVNPHQVFNLMKEADIFVHHSVTSASGDQEGIPTVVMEAMSTGLPVISTYHAGIPELIDDGINGYLVNEKDVEAYALTMQKALCSESSINKNAAQKVRRDFDLELQGNKLIQIYREVIHANIR